MIYAIKSKSNMIYNSNQFEGINYNDLLQQTRLLFKKEMIAIPFRSVKDTHNS